MKVSYRQSLAALSFVLFFGALLGAPYTASAQASLCKQLSHRIYALQEQTTAPTDSVLYMLNLISAAQQCYKPDNAEAQIWLLGHEVDGLDKLTRYADAEARIGDFFENYREDAKDRDVARMYQFLLRLNILQGDLQGATVAYKESKPYLYALEADQRLQQQLNGSHIYMKLGEYEGALDIIRVKWGPVRAEVRRRGRRQVVIIVITERDGRFITELHGPGELHHCSETFDHLRRHCHAHGAAGQDLIVITTRSASASK
jgi:hypothetical protein